MKTFSFAIWTSSFLFLIVACQSNGPRSSYEDLTPEFKNYWYSGVAEISSYKLEQVRYGEKRAGSSVLIFVTEPFSKAKYVKVNKPSDDDVSVMKMNFTKKFQTGIYPYSMMNSVFHPVWEGLHALKASASIQEWCGHTYSEMLNKGKWKITVSSYFEDESGETKTALSWLEDELWTQIRIDPEGLPLGDIEVIPGLFYQRLKHVKAQVYPCKATLDKSDGNFTYTLDYPELDRTLSITFSDQFPWTIKNWEESYPEGGTKMMSSGHLIRQIQTPYWEHNRLQDTVWRDSLFGMGAP